MSSLILPGSEYGFHDHDIVGGEQMERSDRPGFYEMIGSRMVGDMSVDTTPNNDLHDDPLANVPAGDAFAMVPSSGIDVGMLPMLHDPFAESSAFAMVPDAGVEVGAVRGGTSTRYKALAGFEGLDGGTDLIDVGPDDLCGLDVLGAKVVKTSTSSTRPSSLSARLQHAKDVKSALANHVNATKNAFTGVTDAGHTAIAVAKKAADTVAKYNSEQHKPLAPLVPTQIHGHLVGAPAPSSALTPKQKTAVTKHATAVVKHAKATRDLNVAASKAKTAGNAALSFAKSAGPILNSVLTGKKVTVQGAMTLLGADANGKNPGDVGYDPTTDPSSPNYHDPNANPQGGGDGGGITRTADGNVIVTAPDGSPIYDSTTDGNIVALPDPYDPTTDPTVRPVPPYDPKGDSDIKQKPQRDGKLSQQDAQKVWQNTPPGAVQYTGSWPPESKGSYNYFYGGSVGSTYGMAYSDRFQPFGEHRGLRWIFVNGDNGSGNPNWSDGFADDAAAAAKSAISRDTGHGNVAFGPLIGNPSMPDYAGLQYAVADNKWFWQAQNAPSQLTHEIDSALDFTNQKTIADKTAKVKDANDAIDKAKQTKIDASVITIQKIKDSNKAALAADTAAALVVLANLRKQITDQNERKAKQDADNALAESDATSKSNISKTQLQTQQDAYQLDQQKQQDQLNTQQAQFQMEMERAQLQLMQQQAQQQQFQQPDQQYQPQSQQLYQDVPQDDGGGGAVDSDHALPGDSTFNAPPNPDEANALLGG
jgi:hypothetical protein